MSTPIICTRSPRALELPNVRDLFFEGGGDVCLEELGEVLGGSFFGELYF